MYDYKANILKVVDGDTVWLEVKVGFDITIKDSFRLYGINAPEISTPEGRDAKEHLEQLLAPGLSFVTTHKDRREKYGRYLGTLWVGQLNLNQQMITDGFATEYAAFLEEEPG